MTVEVFSPNIKGLHIEKLYVTQCSAGTSAIKSADRPKFHSVWCTAAAWYKHGIVIALDI